MLAVWLLALWLAVSSTAYAAAAAPPRPQDLKRRNDDLSSSSVSGPDSIALAAGFGSSTNLVAVDNQTTTTSWSSSSPVPPSNGYANGSSTSQMSGSSANSIGLSSSVSTNLTPSIPDASTPLSSSSAHSTIPSIAAPSEPLPYSSSATDSSSKPPAPAYPLSNTSSSQVITAVYSKTHVSVIHTGDVASGTSAWGATGVSQYVSTNASVHSSGLLPHSEPYGHGTAHGVLNSTVSRSVRPSGVSPVSGSGSYGINGSATYRGPTGSVPSAGTGIWSDNGTVAGTYGASGSRKPSGTAYPFPNGSISSLPAASGTGPWGYHNGTNATAPFPRTGLGYSYAQACNRASVDWSSSWLKDQIFPTTMVEPTPAYTPQPEENLYTLCDGVPRMRENVSTTHTPYTRWSVTPPATISGAPTQPDCTVVPSDCSQLLSSYSIQHGVPPRVSLGRIHGYMSYIYDDWPRCTTNPIPSSSAGADCGIYGQGIQLLYWPQVWAKGEGDEKYCNALVGHSSSVTLGPTIAGQPNTSVSGTHTFTSPTVYIKYGALSANDWGGVPVGPTLYDSYVGVESTLVSTKLPYFWTSIPWEGPGGLLEIAQSTGIINAKMEHGYTGINLNYADEHVPVKYPDLASPVPALPYYQQRVKLAYYDDTCWMGGCPTMMPWAYAPVLAIPDAVRLLAPEWHSCSLPWGAMDDPPRALVTQTSIIMPTAAIVDPVTTAAQPAPATALPVLQTKEGEGEAARTSEQDARLPEPTTYNDGQARKSQAQEPTTAQPSQNNNEPAPATFVDNQPSRTSSTHDAAGLIASLLGNAGTQATLPQSGSTKVGSPGNSGGDDSNDGSNSQSPPQSNDVDSSPDSGDASPAAIAQDAQPASSSNEGGSTESDGDDPDNYRSGGQPIGAADNEANIEDDSPEPAQGHSSKITLGSDTITARPTERSGQGVLLGSETLILGGPATIISGHSVSVNRDGEVRVDGTAAGQVEINDTPTPVNNPSENVGEAIRVALGPGHVVTAQPASEGRDGAVVGTQTLKAGGPAAIVNGHSVSVGNDGQLAVDGALAGSVALQAGPATGAPAPITLGTQVLTAQSVKGSNGVFVLGGETLREGGAVATLNGNAVSLGTHGKIHVDGVAAGEEPATVPFADMTEAIAAWTLGHQTILAEETTLPGGRIAAIVDGQTITADSAPLTVDGTIILLDRDGIVVQTGEATIPFTASSALITAGPSILTASKTILPNGQTAAVVGTHTLRLGGGTELIDGDVFSLASGGLVELDEATTAAIETSATMLTVDGHILLARYIVNSNGETKAIVGTETLTLGGPAEIVDGAKVSLGPNGIVVGGDGGAKTTAFDTGQTSLVNAASKIQALATETAAPNSAPVVELSMAIAGFLIVVLVLMQF